MPTVLPVLSPAQSALWDQRAASAGIAVETLMDAAGRASAAVLAARYGPALRGGVLVAAGTGNNGGDGWVLARTLHRHDVPIWVAALPGTSSPLNAHARTLALSEGVREVSPDGPWPTSEALLDDVVVRLGLGPPTE